MNVCSRVTAYILRHIKFVFNLPLTKIGPLWVCFYALITHRLIPFKRFIDRNSCWSNIMSLGAETVRMDTKRFKKRIRKRTKHGFPVYVYIYADDSKHFKLN